MEPVIGVTCKHDADGRQVSLHEDYLSAIEDSGGLPLVLPPSTRPEAAAGYARLIGGLLLSGGPDIDPLYFGEEPRGTQLISPVRDNFELALLGEVTRLGKPVLAICRGMQVLNVFAGGDLYQDIEAQYPEALQHMQQAPAWYATHKVELAPGSILARLYGETVLRVNSFHHQAIRMVAPGFRAVAVAKDALIEAIEDTRSAFVVGVQWHPERMWREDDKQALLFRAFVAACQAGSGR